MRQLVTEHVIRLSEARRKRHADARLDALGEAAGAFIDGAGADVGLGEVRMARVEDDGLAVRERVVEQLRVARVPALGHARGLPGDLFLFGVVVDVEVLGLQRPELEPPVLHLVAPEVLRVRRPRNHWQRRRRETYEYCRAPEHGAPLSWSFGSGYSITGSRSYRSRRGPYFRRGGRAPDRDEKMRRVPDTHLGDPIPRRRRSMGHRGTVVRCGRCPRKWQRRLRK